MSAQRLREAADRLDARVKVDSKSHLVPEWEALAAWLRTEAEYPQSFREPFLSVPGSLVARIVAVADAIAADA